MTSISPRGSLKDINTILVSTSRPLESFFQQNYDYFYIFWWIDAQNWLKSRKSHRVPPMCSVQIFKNDLALSRVLTTFSHGNHLERVVLGW